MNSDNQHAAQLIRQLATLKTLNKLSNQFVGKAVDENGKHVDVPGHTLVHMAQLKQAMGFTGSDDDFTIHYWGGLGLLRRHEIVAFGTYQRHRRVFANANAMYHLWFFHIVDRACEIARQIPDDERLMQCVDLFRTLPGARG